MDLQQFLDKIKGKIPIIQGKEKMLFETVRKYGHDSQEAKNAVWQSVKMPKRRQQMMEAIKAIPKIEAQDQSSDLADQIYQLCVVTIFMRPQDTFSLLNCLLRSQNKKKIDQIKTMYGLNHFFKSCFQELLAKLSYLKEMEKQEANEEIKSLIKALKDKQHEYKLDQKDKPQSIQDLQQFKNILIKNRIFANPQSVDQLFQTLQYYGHQVQISHKLIKKSTYPAFEQRLSSIAQHIKRWEDFRQNIDMLNAKLTEMTLTLEQIIQFVECFYLDEQKFQNQLISDYSLDDQQNKEVYQQIIQILTQIMKYVPEVYWKQHTKKMVTYIKFQLHKHASQGQLSLFQEIKLKLTQQLALLTQKDVDLSDIKEYLEGYTTKNSNSLNKLNQEWGIEDQDKQMFAQMRDNDKKVKKYFAEASNRESAVKQYRSFIKQLLAQKDKQKIQQSSWEYMQELPMKKIDVKNEKVRTKTPQIYPQKKKELEKDAITKRTKNDEDKKITKKQQPVQKKPNSNLNFASFKNNESKNAKSNQSSQAKKNTSTKTKQVYVEREQNDDQSSSQTDMTMLLQITRQNKSPKNRLSSSRKVTTKIQQSVKDQIQQFFEDQISQILQKPEVQQYEDEGDFKETRQNVSNQSKKQENKTGKKLKLSKDFQGQAQVKQPSVVDIINPFQEISKTKGQYTKMYAFIFIISQTKFKPQFEVIKRIDKNKHLQPIINRSPVIQFKDYYIAFLEFEMSKYEEYFIYLEQDKRFKMKKSEKKLQKLVCLNKQRNVIFGSSQSAKHEISRQVKSYTFWTAIMYFVKFNNSKTAKGQSIFPQRTINLLSLLFQSFNDYCDNQLSEEQERNVFEKLKIQREVPQLHTNYFLYFFKSFYGKRAQQKYLEYKIYKKMVFSASANFDFARYQKYPQFLQLNRFFFKMNYIHQLKNKKDSSALQKLLVINVKIQPKDQIYSLLAKAVQFNGPYQHYARRDKQIVNILMKNQTVSAIDYFNFRAKYLPLVISNISNEADKSSSLFQEFLDDLITKYKSNKSQSANKIKIDQEDFANIFLKGESTWFFPKKQFIVPPAKHHLILKKMKIVNRLSQGVLNFTKPLQEYLKITQSQNYDFPKLALVFLSHPISQLDKAQARKLFESKLKVDDLLHIFKLIPKYQMTIDEKYLIEHIKLNLISRKYIHQNSKWAFLNELQKLASEIQNSNFVELFLEIFQAVLKITQTATFVNSDKTYYSKDNLKIYLSVLFQMKNDTFKNLLEKKIFTDIKSLPNMSQQFFDKFHEIYPQKVNEPKFEYLVQSYLSNNDQGFQSLSLKFWKYLRSHFEKFLVLKKLNIGTYPQFQKEIVNRLANNLLYSNQLTEIHANLKKNQGRNDDSFRVLGEAADKAMSKYKNFDRKITLMIEIMKGYKFFGKEIKQLESYLRSKQSIKLQGVYQISGQFTNIFEKCDQIFSFSSKKSNLWRKEKITDLQSIAQEYQYVISQIKLKLFQIQDQKILLFQFRNFFTNDNIKDILEYVCQNVKQKEFLGQYFSKLRIEYVQKLGEYLQSLTYLNKLIKSQSENDLNEMLLKLGHYKKRMEEKDEELKASQVYTSIKEIQIFLIKMYNLNQQQENYNMQKISETLSKQHSAIILAETAKSKDMFQMISLKKIDSKSISDLKEYINDLQNSVIGLDIIKEFENVIQYWQLIKKSESIPQFITNLNKLILQHSDLQKNILNCYNSYRLLQQKIDEAVNCQTSFKYQIQAVFRESKLIISKSLEIWIQFNLLSLGNDKIQKIAYKKMNSYRDKSILLINDMSRQQSNDPSILEMIKTFKKFDEFFNIIEAINLKNSHLTNYGCNPEEIAREFDIREGDFTQITIHRDQLQKLSASWVQGIKQHYKKSYLLTHFIGKQLNNFIQSCINKKYHPSLQRIIGISQLDYENKLENQRFVNILDRAKDAKPLQRVQLIVQAFQNFELSFTQSMSVQQRKSLSEINSEAQIPMKTFKNNEKAKPIILLTCNEREIYSFFLQFDQNKQKQKIPQPSQLIFCQQQTSTEEIEVFLYRALIYPSKTYYIVRPNKLKEQVKLSFCNLMTILNKERQQDLRSAQLCFIDSVVNDKLYAFINRPKIFCVEKKKPTMLQVQKNQKKVIKLLGDKITVIQSLRAGLGKTFYAEQKAAQQNKSVKYLLLAGNIKFENLARRLKKLNITQKDVLLIQVGHVENKQKLEVFLSQIIIFKCFYYQQYIYIPRGTTIFVEIENIVDLQPEKTYNIIQMLKKHKKHHLIKQFTLEQIQLNPDHYQDKFVYIYLQLIDKPGAIDEIQQASPYSYQYYYLKEQQTKKLPSKTKDLIEKYFLSWFKNKKVEPTYNTFKYFKKLLFTAFKTFSDSPFFTFLEYPPDLEILKLYKAKSNFLKICIENTLQFLEETVTTNDFDEAKNQNMTQIAEKLKKFPMLIVSSIQTGNYQFVYLSDELVQLPIKSLLLSQNKKYNQLISNIQRIQQIDKIFEKTALCNKKDKILQFEMFKIISQLTGNRKFAAYKQIKNMKQEIQLFKSFIDKQLEGTLQQAQIRIKQIYELIPELTNYKLTLDNFFKMCLIIYRSNSLVPCIIMGESGVGKTAIIEFLVKICFEQTLFIYNVHAGIHEQELEKWYKQFSTKAQDILKNNAEQKKKQRVWVFFDQFNTTDELHYIKQMLIDGRFLGQKIPENIIFLAACNPYRKKRESLKRVKAGIKKIHQNKANNLAFKVKPPTLSMIQLMWDYKQLKSQQNKNYIEKILQEIKYEKKQELIDAIIFTHEYLKTLIEISAVSLRDVARFKHLFKWFLDKMPREDVQTKGKQQKLKFIDKNMDKNERAAILTFVFCYALRFSTNEERKDFLKLIEKRMNYTQGYMKRTITNQQKQYINMLKSPEDKIAYNSALMENVFTSLVCLMNKIPILIIGNPGSSKSLSIKMLNSNLRGENSNSQFCKNLPEINMVYFQGSQSSTSKGVQQVFEKAIQVQKSFQNSKLKMFNSILFDEIGLAQISVHNPLKVLHSKLQVNKSQVGFIGISNWQLDAAKMSRFLVIARSNPDQNQLKETAQLISESYLGKKHSKKEIFSKMGQYYCKFIKQWNSHRQNRDGFYGLRDFYNYVKYVCNNIQQISKDPSELDRVLSQAIQINFDGQKGSVQIFHKAASIYNQKKLPILLNPLELVTKNLQDHQSRCLMLMIRGDSLIPIINQKIQTSGVHQRVICIYGSTFDQDQTSEDYNLEITSQIINHISRGNVVTLKDINNSIQTSLYDLFNKSFSQIGARKYCRIAVGANSNPKCHVHQDFNAVVYVDEQRVKDLDLPFLNRFEKHFLNLQSMITQDEKTLLKSILDWINDLLSFRTKDMILKKQNFIINCSEQSIVTLIIKFRQSPDRVQELVKAKLLQNRTTDFIIGMKNQPQIAKQGNIDSYLTLTTNVTQCKEDMIIFTYDKLSEVAAEQNIFQDQKYIISMFQIKNEKSLRRQLKKGLSSLGHTVQIKLSYQSHYMHINLLLFLSKQIKEEVKKKKQIIIVVQLHRFTLHQLNLQYINISYLHDFEQYFVQNIRSLQTIPRILQLQNCWQLYQLLNISDQFLNYHLETVKLIKLKCPFQEIQQLKKSYFNEIVSIGANDLYKQKTQGFLKKIMFKKKVDFSALQTNAEDIMCSSNIEEAITKYLGDILKEIIFIYIKNIIEEGHLFFFEENLVLKMIDAVFKNHLWQYYEEQREFINELLILQLQASSNKLFSSFAQIKQTVRFTKAVQHNIITIKNQTTLIPMSYKDFDLILKNKQISNSNNLQELANRLPLLKAQQNDAQYDLQLEECFQFIEQKFKVQNNDVIKKVNKHENLKKLYLFDVLQYYLEYNNLHKQDLCHYVQFISTVFKQYPIQEILLILTRDKRIFTLLLELFSRLIKLPFTGAKNIIRQLGQLHKKQIGQAVIQCLKNLLEISFQYLELSERNIKEFGKVKNEQFLGLNQAQDQQNLSQYKNYFYHFSSIFMKIRQIMIQYKNHGLEWGPNILTTHFLLNTLQKISLEKNQQLKAFIQSSSSEHSINYQIYLFFEKILKTSKADEQIILNYLCLKIYIEWIQTVISKDSQFKEELKVCIRSFVDLCNQYVLFANNANYFISYLLPNFQNHSQIQDLMSYFAEQEQTNLINFDQIDMENNFTVALGNFMSSQIALILLNKFEQNTEVPQVEVFVCRNYYGVFNQALQSRSQQNKLDRILRFQFLKKYGEHYIKLLMKNQENTLLNSIDGLLRSEGQIRRHLRLYLLKILYSEFKTFQNIKRQFIEISQCQWILRQTVFLEEKVRQIFYPPPLLDKNDRLLALMEENKQQRFAVREKIHQLILEGLKSSKNTYQLLTFFMYAFYSRKFSQQFADKVKVEINQRGDLKQPKNKIIFELLTRYLNYKVSERLYIKDTSHQQFQKQLPYLNYLNIIAAYRSQECPYLQMFFQKSGQPLTNYSQQLSSKFLFGSLSNPALERFQFILRRQKLGYRGNSYINCSNQCDYLMPVGGNFYGQDDGCQHPTNHSNCGFCGQVVGAHEYNVLTNPEARRFNPRTLKGQLTPILQSRDTLILRKLGTQNTKIKYNLRGYQSGNTLQLVIKHLEFKRHYEGVAVDFMEGQSEAIHYSILQSIVYFVWYFLAEAQMMDQQSLANLFQQNSQGSKQGSKKFLLDSAQFYFNTANRSIKFNNQKDSIIWHLGVGKVLAQIFQNYKIKHPSRQCLSLEFSFAKKTFQSYVNNLIFPLCEKEKEKFILVNRIVQAKNKSDIVRQIGDYQQHLAQYPFLKIFKLQNQQLTPCYKNMKIQYKETLNREYPLLYYLMNNPELQERLKCLKDIYVFISRLWKMFNLRISREDGKRGLQEILFQSIGNNENERAKARQQLQRFIVAWNKLTQLKYQLSYGCHGEAQLGRLQKIQKKYPLGNFLLEKNHLDNLQGQKLIALIQVSAKEYNGICLIIQNLIKKVSHDQSDTHIFSAIRLNPSILDQDSSLLQFPTQFLEKKIYKFSSFSVEYGISMPYYAFDHIESLAVKELYGYRYLIEDPEKFCYFSYIGEKYHFITELRQYENQKSLEQTGMKQRVIEYLRRTQTQNYETFYKTIRLIQGSLQNIVVFFKNFKVKDSQKKTIRQFVRQRGIKAIVREVEEEPIQSLPLSNLADLYELIEYYTFQKVQALLDSSYKKPLQKEEKEKLIQLIRLMKQQQRQLGIPSFKDFKVALYRLAGRNLVLMLTDSKKLLSEQLCQIPYYWPKDFDINQFKYAQSSFTKLMVKLEISRVGQMLKVVPFREPQKQENKTKKPAKRHNETIYGERIKEKLRQQKEKLDEI